MSYMIGLIERCTDEGTHLSKRCAYREDHLVTIAATRRGLAVQITIVPGAKAGDQDHVTIELRRWTLNSDFGRVAVIYDGDFNEHAMKELLH
jgi:hypothetical protein